MRHWIALFLAVLLGLSVPTQAQDAPYNEQGALCVNVNFQYLQALEPEEINKRVPRVAQISRPDVVLLIVDRSGSMDEPIIGGSERRMSVAQTVLEDYITRFSSEDLVGMRILGGECETSLVRSISPLTNPQALIRDIYALQPSGMTPLAQAIEQAGNDLASFTGVREVILVSDGEETCNGDPVAAAEALANSDPSLKVSINIVGFNVLNNVQAQDNLRMISSASDGVFVTAENDEELLQALSVTERVPFFVTDSATNQPVGEGFANRSAVPLFPQEYLISVPALDIADQLVTVERGRGVSLSIAEDGNLTINTNDSGCIAEFCPDVPLPRLTIGEMGRVSAQDPRPLNVRNAPGLSASRIYQLPIGSTFEVLDGPICRDGYLWWNIKSTEGEGWAAEGVPGNYFVEPMTN